ncbi:unnamed protein product [Onchocerca ochengi]|uniref:INCENP_ARK-bind domain-containing protein n=1 Tax=Onchocerca ochengi TaxID=42157 RepID=A0A182E9T7_ONCOC|nr:unnamed protein product [Onchocerca ochengi]
MCKLRHKRTQINDQTIGETNLEISPNLRQIFEEITNKVMDRLIIPEFNQRAMEYQQWIFDEQNKAEQILKDSGYTLPRTRQINFWPDNFSNFLEMTNKNKRNNENEACYAVNGLTRKKVDCRSNSSQYSKSISSLSIDDYNNLPLPSTVIAKSVNNFCAKRTANVICKKKQILEAEAGKTRNNIAHICKKQISEDREHRLKQCKKGLEKEDKQRRNQSLGKFKLQASNVATNRESKLLKLSATPIAKRTRSALHSAPIAKRLRSRKTETFHDETKDNPNVILESDINRTACAKSYPKTTILSELETAIPEISNMETRFSPKFNGSVSQMKKSSQILDEIPDFDNMKSRYTGIETAEVSKLSDALELLTPKNSSKENDDPSILNTDSSLSSAINTASVLERTRPCYQSISVNKQSIYGIHQDETREIDSDDKLRIAKRSTRSIHNRTTYLKYKQNINDDDLRIVPMDLKSSSRKSKSKLGDDVAKDVEEKRGKVTSTRFPGRITLDGLEEQEYAKIPYSMGTKKKTEETDCGIYDLSSSSRTDPSEEPCKKIPYWAKDEEVRKTLEKQHLWSLTDIDALFGKIHPPVMQKMFDGKIRVVARSSSAMWESPIWNPRVGHSACHFMHEQSQNQNCNIRRSQRVKKHVSYVMYF